MLEQVPDTIGGYQVLKRIGHGATGTVYQARDTERGRDVAIRVLRPVPDDDARARVSREVRLLAHLDHPNIAKVFDTGEDHQGTPFLITEYVDGETLGEFITHYAATLSHKLLIMEQVCAALDHAHQLGFVHGDVKPGNVMISAAEVVKVLDFGVARIMGTTTGVAGAVPAIAALHYIAPEQIEGRPVDARADQFSAGAVFFELLTSRRAFPGDSAGEVIHQVMYGTPALIGPLSPRLDGRLVGIVHRCLAKRPADRFPSLREVAEALREIRLPSEAASITGSSLPDTDIDLAGAAAAAADVEAGWRQIRAEQLRSLVQTARRSFDVGDLDAAVALCNEALKLDPHDPEGRELSRRVLTVKEASESDPSTTAALRVFFSEGQPELAIRAESAERAPDPVLRLQAPPPVGAPAVRSSTPAPKAVEGPPPVIAPAPAAKDASSPARAARAAPTPAPKGGIVGRLFNRRSSPGPTGGSSATAKEPLSGTKPQVVLTASAPRQAVRATTFAAQFVVQSDEHEAAIKRQLHDDDPAPTLLGRAPGKDILRGGGRWAPGAPVTVRAYGGHLRIEPATQSFEWNGSVHVLTFRVTVGADAPETVQLCFEACIEAVPLARIPVDVRVVAQAHGSEPVTVSAQPASTAFASYAAQDAPRVALCMSALKRWDPGLDVVMDCLDLTPTKQRRKELERIIPTKDAFFLFWSAHAKASKSVAWELDLAATTKGLDYVRPVPLDDPDLTPPPDELEHLQFRERFLMAKDGFLRLDEFNH